MVRFSVLSLATSALLMTALAASPARSQEDAERARAQEEQVDDGLKKFGYIAGQSRGCVAENQHTAFERDVLDIHAAITRLLGVDRAFLFSAAFGYGTSMALETEKCADILKQYESRSSKFRSAAQGG